jgi:hypothetical protein
VNRNSLPVLLLFLLSWTVLLPAQDNGESGDAGERTILRIEELRERASGFALGIILGEPSGLSAKVTGSGSMAVDAALAWSFLSDNPGLYLHSDLLYHLNGFQMDNGAFFRPFAGIGGAVNFASDFKIALRIPVGLAFYFTTIPIEVFVEAAPGLLLFPETSSYLAGGIGIRYQLKKQSAD